MKKVAVTGMGIVSCLGLDKHEVERSLRAGKSGVRFQDKYRDIGMKSQVAGSVEIADLDERIPRKQLRFMGPAASYAYLSMQQAIEDAGLQEQVPGNPRVGLIAGSGGGSTSNLVNSADMMRESGLRKVGPYRVTRTMGSTVSACLATAFGIQGVNYSISSACATSAHCIGNAMQLIQSGAQDIIFAGAGEEEDWTMSCLFDAMGALSRSYNDTPECASRPYDKARDGFVIAGGGGMIVLEEWEHARARGAPIYAELLSYAANSDGHDMVAPSGEGAQRCIGLALESVSAPIDYINTHGTSTPVGDLSELKAIAGVFGEGSVPPLSSTKSLTGHSLGAAGVQEAIYSLLMLKGNFIAASANIEERDEQISAFPIVTELRETPIRSVLSNNFGFGGTNACLVFGKP